MAQTAWYFRKSNLVPRVSSSSRHMKRALCLYNFLRQTDSAGYCPNSFCDSEDNSGEMKPGQWRKELPIEGIRAMSNLPPLRGRKKSNSAIEVQNALKDYFLSDKGQIPWQLDYVWSRGPTYKPSSLLQHKFRVYNYCCC